MCDLSSPSGDQTCNPCNGRRSLNHWTTKEVLLNSTLDESEQGSQSLWGRADISSDLSLLPLEQGRRSPQRLITSSTHRLHRLPRLHTSSSPPYPCKRCYRIRVIAWGQVGHLIQHRYPRLEPGGCSKSTSLENVHILGHPEIFPACSRERAGVARSRKR